MSRNDLPADVLAACGGSALRLFNRQSFTDSTVSHSTSVRCLAWNRNNKVVATGCQDGAIQLSYSNGQAMSLLRADSASVPLGTLNSVDWSMGSKFLAAGSDNGNVYVWDLKVSKTYTQLARQPGAITSVRYHPDDNFLAVASSSGGTVTLYDFQGGELASLHSMDGSTKYSIQATPGEAALACGTQHGGVLVWDWAHKQVKEHYQQQHMGSVAAVSFIPLKPSMLYSAGSDGRLILQDRRSGPGFASRTEVGVPLASLSVKEDYTSVAVGATDGMVLLYDPRQLTAPLHRLSCAPGLPVVGLHWQHCYGSLGSRMRGGHTVVKAKASQDGAAAAAAGAEARTSALPGTAATVSQAAGGSRIPQAVPVHATAGNPTYSSMRRHSGIGTGGASAAAGKPPSRQPVPLMPPAAQAAPTPVGQLNPLFDHQSAAAQETPGAGSSMGGAGAPPAGLPTQQAAAAPVQQLRSLGSAFGAGHELSITPLSGMASQHMAAAPTPGHTTPPYQHPAATTTPPPSASAAQPPASEATPLQPYGTAAAAPLDFAITPLSTMAPRPPARTAAAAAAQLPAATYQPATGAAALAELNITPLPGMRLAAAGSRTAAALQPATVLQERTNHRALQEQLSSLRQQERQILQRPLPQRRGSPPQPDHSSPASATASGEDDTSPQAHSPAPAAENLPSPAASVESAGSGKVQPVAETKAEAQRRAGMVQEDSAVLHGGGKLAARKQAQLTQDPSAALSRQASEGEGGWLVKAARGQRQEGGAADVIMLDATLLQQQPAGAENGSLQRSPSQGFSPAFSFKAAAQQAAAPDAKLGRRSCAEESPQPSPAAAVVVHPGSGAGTLAAPHGLREDILALHLDMLNQFQAQQEQMSALVHHVVERQDALTGEVGALRRQLQELMQTRNDFLWL